MRSKERNFFSIVFGFFMLVLFVSSVSAIGIGGRDLSKTVYFTPNMEISETYTLRPTSHQTMDYEFEMRGGGEANLSQYVTFEPEILKDVGPRESRQFTANINLPEKIEIPGRHSLYLCVGETLASGGQFGSRSVACARISVIVQHEGKYLEARFNAPDANIGEEVSFKVNVENWGTKTIGEVKAKVNVYDYNGNLKGSANSNSVSLGATESNELVAVLDISGYDSGAYTAEAIVDWDGEQTVLEDNFRVGLMDVEIKDYTNEFEIGSINAFHIEVENLWNGELSNVYAVVDLPDRVIQTPTTDLRAWESKRLTAYWEKPDVEAGKHEAEIILHFEGQTKTEEITVQVVELEEEWDFNALLVVVLVIGLILIISIGWSLVRRNGKNLEIKKKKK